MQRNIMPVMLALFVILLVACGGTSSPAEVRDPVAFGDELYNGTPIGAASSPGCITCHSLQEGVTVVGPSHAGLGARAGNIVPGQSAEEYLRESIIDPDAHITEGFSPGTMYRNYGNELTNEEIDALVAYMLTLK